MNALTDWRGGIVLAIAILLAFFGPDLFPAIPPWAWLIGGGVAWGAIVLSILGEKGGGAGDGRSAEAEIRADCHQERRYARQVDQGVRVSLAIAAAVARARQGVLRDHLEQTASEIDDWIGGLWEVVRRVDTFETDRTIQQDLQSVPAMVQNLEARVRAGRTRMCAIRLKKPWPRGARLEIAASAAASQRDAANCRSIRRCRRWARSIRSCC
jgi:hypothetical protein